MKNSYVRTYLLFVLVTFSCFPSFATDKAPLIGIIHNIENGVGGGCGLMFERSGKPYFWQEPGDKKALMNIEGKDVWLSGPLIQDGPQGSCNAYYFTSEGITAELKSCVTFSCHPQKNECDSDILTGKLTITKGQTRQSVELTGWAGC